MTKKRQLQTGPTGQGIQARIPGHGNFTVTGNAAAMIDVFGGLLHCYEGHGPQTGTALLTGRAEETPSLPGHQPGPRRTRPQ
jgi:hypothetical protein